MENQPELIWEVVERTTQYTRIKFYPITGRTHQLRVHAAHVLGLNTITFIRKKSFKTSGN